MESSSSSSKYIREADVRDNDVIIKRGAGPRSRPGNQRFLALVRRYRPEYMSAEPWCDDKKSIATRIYNTVVGLNPPGRFLKEVENERMGEETTWEILEEYVVIRKIQQSFRDMQETENRSRKRSSNDVMPSISDLLPSSVHPQAPSLTISGGASLAQGHRQSAMAHPSALNPMAAYPQVFHQAQLFQGATPLPRMSQASLASNRANHGTMPTPAALAYRLNSTSPSVSRGEASLRDTDLTVSEIVEREIELGRRHADLGHQIRLQSYEHVLRQHIGAPRNFGDANPGDFHQQLGGYRPFPPESAAYLDLAEHAVPSPHLCPQGDTERAGESGSFLRDLSISAGHTAGSIGRFASETLEDFRRSWSMRREEVPEYPPRNSERSESEGSETRVAASNGESTNTSTGSRLEQTPASVSIGTGAGSASIGTDRNDMSDAQEFLLSTLSYSTPMFTEEDLRREMNELTVEERAQVLTDLFADELPSEQRAKKVKRDESDHARMELDELLKRMQEAIEDIPLCDKLAYLEAKMKASEQEFSRHRMSLFLHREDMDPKRAALRLVNYWKERKVTFGPEKFILPMTLKGALRDDHAALKAGFLQLLPGLDTSGRQLALVRVRNHTLEGYTRDSMIRAVWYIFEAIAEHPNAAKGFVVLSCRRGISLWNFDLPMFRRLIQFRSFIPLENRALHSCNMSPITQSFFKPWIDAIRDKRTRTREIPHTAERAEFLSSLAKYGINEDVVPVEIGGKCEYDHIEWLANRLAQGK